MSKLGASATGKSRPTNTERERVNKLIEERRKVHTALEKDTVDSILEQAAEVAETERQLDGKSGSINKLLKLISKDRMWFKRLRDIGKFEPFQQMSDDEREHQPPSLSTLAELTRVGETNWPDVAGIIKPKMTRNEVKDAIKNHIPPLNHPKPRRSKKPEEKRDELVDQLIKLLLNAHTALNPRREGNAGGLLGRDVTRVTSAPLPPAPIPPQSCRRDASGIC